MIKNNHSEAILVAEYFSTTVKYEYEKRNTYHTIEINLPCNTTTKIEMDTNFTLRARFKNFGNERNNV